MLKKYMRVLKAEVDGKWRAGLDDSLAQLNEKVFREKYKGKRVEG